MKTNSMRELHDRAAAKAKAHLKDNPTGNPESCDQYKDWRGNYKRRPERDTQAYPSDWPTELRD